ncbi:hypothetical protein B0T14DRAFT_564189 [Immersiella caudata]|uniref:Uncharacterized protein n=1 Tax=Immersiella caudata TaxID=314043 RepID=A0AA39WWP0_9PEZI|nr:hypothetical protein B0T14DRAFT_564189 [Immersiella caudata]
MLSDSLLRKLVGHVDFAVFEQILEMDDDEAEREYSKAIVDGYLTQFSESKEVIKAALLPDVPEIVLEAGTMHFPLPLREWSASDHCQLTAVPQDDMDLRIHGPTSKLSSSHFNVC